MDVSWTYMSVQYGSVSVQANPFPWQRTSLCDDC